MIGRARRRLVAQLAESSGCANGVPALWRPEWPHRFADLRCRPGTDAWSARAHLPALVLAEGSTADQPLTSADWLVRRGWTYLEPPVSWIPLPERLYESDLADPSVPSGPDGHAPEPMLLTPCGWSEPTPALTEPVDSESEWWRRSAELGRRCAVLVAQDVDLYASDVAAELDAAASRGRVLWTIARMGPVPSTSAWHFAPAPSA